MGFQLVSKSVTLNDLERRNNPYFALFHRIHVRCRRKKLTFAISSPDEFLVFIALKISIFPVGCLSFNHALQLPDFHLEIKQLKRVIERKTPDWKV